MKYLISFCLLMFASWMPVHAASTETLLEQLTTTKLSKLPDIVEQLAAQEDESLLPVFRAWLAGDLHYVKDSNAIVVEIDVQGNDAYVDPFTQVQLEGISSKDVKKIKVNNKLRGLLRGVIARLQ